MSAPVNRTLHRVVWSVLILVIAGLVAGFVRQQWRGVERRGFTRLEQFRKVPDFTLTERTGQPFDSSALKGKIWLADFFFTACPGPCLVMNGRVQEVQGALRKTGQDVQMVSFSINPEGDTPEVLRRYAERFHAETGKWFFLTGDRAKIYDVAKNGFMLAVQEDQKDEAADGAAATPHPPQFTHSTMIALVDRQGVVRGYYNSTNPEVVQKLLLDIGNLLREQPRA
jgi:protein SCO1/2